MRVALLGGTGFIGSRVATHLLRSGHEVAVVHRGHRAVPPGAVSLVADRADPARWPPTWHSFRPEALVDMSAYASGDVDQAGAALDGPLQRVTVISSGDVYATYGAFLGQEPPPPDPTAPIPETGALRSGRYPYRAQASGPDDLRHDYDKILVEAGYRARSPVPVTVLRLPIVYGPGDPHRRVATDLARLRDAPGGVLELHPQEAAWRCTRGYVDDVAAAIGLATTHPQALGQTYNLGEPDALSTREWLGAISQLGGIATEVRETPAAAPSLPVRWTVSLTVRTDRIRAELGYVEPIGRAEGLPRTVRAAAA